MITGAAAITGAEISAWMLNTFLPNANAADARLDLGCGSLATQDANNVSITGGSITNLSVFDGVVIDGGTYVAA